MNDNFSRDFVNGFTAHEKGGTLYIDGADFLPNTIDYADIESVKILATNAVHTADGLYDLIKNNCNTLVPDLSVKGHLEMYMALAGLACEIYLKSIIYNENLNENKQIKGHKLNELFIRIPVSYQEEIRTEISNIDEILSSICDLFTTLRYDFELNHVQGDYLAVFKIMEKLKTISHRYPTKNIGSIRYLDGCLMFE